MSHNNHNVHSQIIGLLTQIVAATLLESHGRSTSPQFKALVSGGAKIAAENIWNKYGSDIEDMAQRVASNGGTQNHVNSGAQQLVNNIWADYHN